MKYQLIATDFDYTLVGKDKVITKENKEAIQKAMDKGVLFVLCSGRSHISLEHFEKELNIVGENIYGICFNGAIIYETKTRKQIYEKLLSNNTSKHIIKELKKFDASVMVYIGGNLYVENNKDPFIKEYIKICRVPVETVDNFLDLKQDFSKILVTGTREKLMEICQYMNENANGQYNAFFSFDTLLEFTNPEATKGNALSYLARYLKIPMENVIAIGDNHNDISMIQNAGMGIAVANAVDELKAVANNITTNDCENSAIKEVIDQYIFSYQQ